MAAKFLTHLKDNGHVWVIVFSLAIVAGYVCHVGKRPEQQLIADVVLALVSAGTVSGGSIALIVIALIKNEKCGDLAEFKNWLVLGLLVGVCVAAIELLKLFGVVAM